MRRLTIMCVLVAGCAGDAAFNNAPPCAMNECPIEKLPFAIEIDPAVEMYQGTVLAARFASMEFAGDGVKFDPNTSTMNVSMVPAIRIYGLVKIGTTNVKLNGSIVATRPSRIPGRPDRAYSAQINATTGAYELRVPPNQLGEQYTLRIDSADDSTYPPQIYTVFADQEVYFDFKLDDPADLTQLRGDVQSPLGAPIPGMRVQAVDSLTGKPVSTTALTDSSGAYALKLAKKATGTVVRLEATPSTTAPDGTPLLATRVDVSKTGPANTVTARIQAPAVPAPVEHKYRVVGPGAGMDMPVVGAHCLLSADISDMTSQVTATHTVPVVTDADGYATASLISGTAGSARTYSFTISPPAESEFQGATVELHVAGNGGVGSDIALAVRPQLSGRVIDMLGRPIAGVTVQPGPATVDKIASATTLADLLRITSGISDLEGRFTVRVDSGNYDLGLIPLTASRLPRRWIDNQSVMGDTQLGDVLAPPGTLATIQVVDPAGHPLKAASLQLYELSENNRDCLPNQLTCLSPARLTAEGKTSSDGAVSILLPAMVDKPAGSR